MRAVCGHLAADCHHASHVKCWAITNLARRHPEGCYEGLPSSAHRKVVDGRLGGGYLTLQDLDRVRHRQALDLLAAGEEMRKQDEAEEARLLGSQGSPIVVETVREGRRLNSECWYPGY